MCRQKSDKLLFSDKSFSKDRVHNLKEKLQEIKNVDGNNYPIDSNQATGSSTQSSNPSRTTGSSTETSNTQWATDSSTQTSNTQQATSSSTQTSNTQQATGSSTQTSNPQQTTGWKEKLIS